MITQEHGNLLEADVDALVKTVNTVGVMGKGIALQFKRAYPDMFANYARAAKSGGMALGRMQVWPTGMMMARPRFIINFPTNGHWRAPSKLVDIERGLDDLVRAIRELGVRSIAIPPLGCGNGGSTGLRSSRSFAANCRPSPTSTCCCTRPREHPRPLTCARLSLSLR